MLRVLTVAWKTMLGAITAPLSAQMEALLLSPAMARCPDVRYLCLVDGLSMSPYFGRKSRYTLTLIVRQRPIFRGARRTTRS